MRTWLHFLASSRLPATPPGGVHVPFCYRTADVHAVYPDLPSKPGSCRWCSSMTDRTGCGRTRPLSPGTVNISRTLHPPKKKKTYRTSVLEPYRQVVGICPWVSRPRHKRTRDASTSCVKQQNASRPRPGAKGHGSCQERRSPFSFDTYLRSSPRCEWVVLLRTRGLVAFDTWRLLQTPILHRG